MAVKLTLEYDDGSKVTVDFKKQDTEDGATTVAVLNVQDFEVDLDLFNISALLPAVLQLIQQNARREDTPPGSERCICGKCRPINVCEHDVEFDKACEQCEEAYAASMKEAGEPVVTPPPSPRVCSQCQQPYSDELVGCPDCR